VAGSIGELGRQPWYWGLTSVTILVFCRDTAYSIYCDRTVHVFISVETYFLVADAPLVKHLVGHNPMILTRSTINAVWACRYSAFVIMSAFTNAGYATIICGPTR
jgi:hypothetical protein